MSLILQFSLSMLKSPFFFCSVASDDFKQGVYKLADLLKVPKHPDHLITLDAITTLIKDKFNVETLKEASTKFPSQGTPIDFSRYQLTIHTMF